MLHRRANRCWVLALGLFFAGLMVSSACNVPVFRYALERWPADAYELVVFHREPLTTNQQALLNAWQEVAEKGLVNLSVEKLNVQGEMPPSRQALWKAQTNPRLPWMVLLHPRAREIETPVWTESLDAPGVKSMIESPARRELVRRLSKGDSAVWLLVESGNKAKDDAVAKLLDTESRRLENSFQLPEAALEDPKLRSEVPLKIAFSTMRVSRKEPAEQMLLRMLLSIDKEIAAETDPMVFAVFGRGRAFPPLRSKDLSESVLQELAEFLIGACSCQVKSLNPGFDLLLAADWEGSLEGKVVKDPELPPLIGMAQFAALATSNTPPPVAVTNTVSPDGTKGGLSRNLRFVILVGFGLLVAGTMVVKWKRPGPKP